MLEDHSLHREKARNVPNQVFVVHIKDLLTQHHLKRGSVRQGRSNSTAALVMARSRVMHASRFHPQNSPAMDTERKEEQREAQKHMEANHREGQRSIP